MDISDDSENSDNPVYDAERKSLRKEALSLDDFALLGLPRRFDLTTREVEDAFSRLAARVHPDRFANRPEEERKLADAIYVRLGEARARLADDFERADYLVGLMGGPSAADLKETPPEFLLFILELQDQLQKPDVDREAVARRVNAMCETLHATLSDIMKEAQDGGAEKDGLKHARRILNKISYLRKLRSDFSL